MVWQYVLVAAGSYLMGAIPTGWLVTKLRRGVDIRDYGSGATGGTNVLRVMGFRGFLIVAVADILKAYIPVLSTYYIFEPFEGVNTAHNLQAVAGVAAIVGHDWPIYIGFRGGGGGGAPPGGGARPALFPLSPARARAR